MRSLSEHAHRIAEHARRFAFLPLLGGSVELPTADGDISELEELADRILATALPDPLEDYAGWWDGYRILEFASWTGISFRMDPWPEDEAAALIEAWKAS